MKIAISANCDFFSFDFKNRLRNVARAQKLTICFAISNNIDPLNTVFLFHRMGNIADSYLESISAFLNDRNMLLGSGVG